MLRRDDETGRLILEARQSLYPAPFPPRRDLDVAFLGSDGGTDDTIFHDAFWVRPDELAGFVVRIGGAAQGCLLAHAFRALLRAALPLHPTRHALKLSLRALLGTGTDMIVDAAVAVVSARTGEVTVATHGEAEAVHASRDHAGTAQNITKGEFLCLTVGAVARPFHVGSDAGDLVHDAVAGAQRAGVLAVGLKQLRAARDRRFVLRNDVAKISPLLSDLERYLAAENVPADVFAYVEVALDEHLTNVLLYAYADGGAHEVIVTVRVIDMTLHIDVEDDGTPFDPTLGPPPDLAAPLEQQPVGGLGLHLIRSAFDGVAYRRIRGWNVLGLTKHIAPRAQGPEAMAAGEFGDHAT